MYLPIVTEGSLCSPRVDLAHPSCRGGSSGLGLKNGAFGDNAVRQSNASSTGPRCRNRGLHRPLPRFQYGRVIELGSTVPRLQCQRERHSDGGADRFAVRIGLAAVHVRVLTRPSEDLHLVDPVNAAVAFTRTFEKMISFGLLRPSREADHLWH